MDEYGITDEASVVSGHSVTIRRITDMEKDDYSYYHSDRIVEMRYSRIYESFRREFFMVWKFFDGMLSWVNNDDMKTSSSVV